MKEVFALATVVLIGFGGTAQAADPYAADYGNTLAVTGADGTKSTAYLNQDMTWEQHLANGPVIKGTYAWKDATTACFTQTDPAPKADQAPICLSGQTAHAVGDTWSVTSSDGKTSTMTLTAGR